MSEYTKNWIVRFVRKDGKLDEEYYYNTQAEAEYHRNLFQDDDSGLYERIDVEKDEQLSVKLISEQ
jgi:hypothetical protein